MQVYPEFVNDSSLLPFKIRYNFSKKQNLSHEILMPSCRTSVGVKSLIDTFSCVTQWCNMAQTSAKHTLRNKQKVLHLVQEQVCFNFVFFFWTLCLFIIIPVGLKQLILSSVGCSASKDNNIDIGQFFKSPDDKKHI